MPPTPIRAARPLGPLGSLPARHAYRRADRRASGCSLATDAAAAPTTRRIARAAALGAQIVDIDIEPFYETARLLYEGPWVAERYHRAQVAAGVVAGLDSSCHQGNHRAGRAADARSMLRRILRAGGTAPRRATLRSGRSTCCCCRPHRRPIRSSRCWPIRSSSTAGSAPIPISSICSICAGWRCHPRCAPTACRSASRCWRLAGTMRCCLHRPRVSRRHRPAAGRARSAAAAARAACRRCAAADEIAIAVVGAHLSGMPLNGELKSLRRPLSRSHGNRARLSALRASAASSAAEAGPAARRAGRRARHRGRDLGHARRRLWPLRRRHPAAAVDRHAAARRDGRTVKGFLVEADATAGAR